MANEFVAKNGLISQNNTTVSGSLTATQGVTASLFGTASWSNNSVTASYIVTTNIVGNLSQIASGSVTASVTPSQFSVVSGSTTEFTITGTGVTIGGAITDIHRVTGSLGITGSLTINGTSIATSYRQLVAVDSGNTSHSGSVAETIVSSLLIPANSLDSLCDLYFSYDYGKNNANLNIIKFYTNTTNSLSGATQLGQLNTGSTRNGGFFRKMLLRGTTLDTQYSTATIATNWPGEVLFAATTTQTFNPAVINYFIISITLSSAVGETFTTKRTILEKLKLSL